MCGVISKLLEYRIHIIENLVVLWNISIKFHFLNQFSSNVLVHVFEFYAIMDLMTVKKLFVSEVLNSSLVQILSDGIHIDIKVLRI
jgi:hypothetical protein